MSDPVTVARAAWGETIPDWVLRLAEECAASSQSKVAARIGRSPAMVSTVLRAKYKGSMAAVEDLVRGTYMHGMVQCPALGEISAAVCRGWMLAARTYTPANSERVRMYRACRACPRNQKESSK